MKWVISFFLILCACSSGVNQRFSIALDPKIALVDLGEKQAYAMGYIDDFLMALSKQSGKNLEKITLSSSKLLPGLEKENYQAIISALQPYPFYQEKYDFSEGFLQVGMVLVVTGNSPLDNLEKMEEKKIGFLQGDFPSAISNKLPKKVIIETYPSYVDLLIALEKKEIEGAILPNLAAISFLEDTFSKKLKIVEKPVLDRQLRLVTLKGKQKDLMRYFHEMKGKRKTQKLLEKWGLKK